MAPRGLNPGSRRAARADEGWASVGPVSEQPDPERLLAEALRAQAVRAPVTPTGDEPSGARRAEAGPAEAGPEPTGPVADRASEAPTGPEDQLLRLFSGTENEHGLLSGRADETATGSAGGAVDPVTGPVRPAAGRTTRLRAAPRPVPVWWIVLLAVLLGLAAGAVVGLISLT